MNLKVPNLDETIDKMNEAGLLLKKSDGKYEVTHSVPLQFDVRCK